MVYQTEVTNLASDVGVELGPTAWRAITQAEIDAFADVTGDDQWVHIDTERAAQGPFGTTIAHGFLTLSLIPAMLKQLIQINGSAMGINYGLNRVRFPSPVKSGSRIRARGRITEVERTADGAYQYVISITIEVEGQAKPACVAEAVFRRYVA